MPFCSKSAPTLVVLCIFLIPWDLHSAYADDAQQQAAACVACHPMSAASPIPTSASPSIPPAPIIWGQNAGYLYLQLRDFKSAMRASENDAIMHAITQPLSDAQMLAIAEYVSAQPWPKLGGGTTSPTDPLLRRGAELLAYGDCGACHFNDWRGYSATPRLRGQTSAYLTATIGEFRSGKRANSPGMSDLMQVYSADDVKAIVAYLSSLE
jgi:cytochrome c553